MGLPAFRAASEALLARRRDQRGFRTLGDEHDRALARTLGQTADLDLAEVERVGVALGRDVYSRRFYEDSIMGAAAVLSTCLAESGLGTLRLETHFHRTALLQYHPEAELAAAPAHALVRGIVSGYFSCAFNCEAHVESRADALHLKLLHGRDVNRGSSA